ncbi:MAG TPA: RNA polymerase sigma factor [Saprospiraceae bacterium]|nr:RNA polymerase sigma factor [Saprospiraceae bacterium]
MVEKQKYFMDISISLRSNEQEVIQACIRNENWAQKLVYEEYYEQMLCLCMRYSSSHEDALDILHDGFLKVFQHIPKYEVGTMLSAWIRRIMVNTAIDFYRRESRRSTADLDEARTVWVDGQNVIGELNAEDVMKAIQMLSPIYRSIFNLYVMEGFSHKEIADTLHISEGTSRSNLVKARQKLKEMLIHYER